MPVLHVPASLRDASGGRERFEVEGTTLREVFAAVRASAPDLFDRLVEDGDLRPDVAVAIDGSILEDTGMFTDVAPDAEIYLVPPIGGG
ncbi:MAG: MoaD/ThiS family protein [Dehalococcoidia bacterium]|nr:MoaD/ThiS family protein [Dehalococcoidia bacterium]MCB9492453.1 MoaD/ThiS family protein [Dehalococcoidia bacterium]